MKRISAVVCELNPAHEGHKHIFSRASEFGDVVVAIMSGNFVQRGDCAIYSKWDRAEDAVKNGAHAGMLLKAVSAIAGGGGGGRPDSATSGGKDLSKLDDAMKEANDILKNQLK